MRENSDTPQMNENKFISFTISGQTFCVDIMAVREIRGWAKPTPIPHSPSYVCGVINLRGTVLPIVDLGARLGMPSTEPSPSNVTIVVQIGEQLIGLVVEAVSDILSLKDSILQPTPEIASETSKAFFKSLVALEGNMIRVIDLTTLAPVAQTSAAA